MKYFFIFLLLCSFQDDCGIERWSVKTLTDENAKYINYKPIHSSIKKLSFIQSPIKITSNTPRLKQEQKTYSITCLIKEYRKEEDGDYHLILISPKDSSLTMVGEIPDPDCEVMADCPKLSEIQSARTYFDFRMKEKNNKVKSGIYKVTGVFIFDKPHKTLGASKNFCELHPILSIKKIK